MRNIFFLTDDDRRVTLFRADRHGNKIEERWRGKELFDNQMGEISLIAGKHLVITRPHQTKGTFLIRNRGSKQWREDSYPDSDCRLRPGNLVAGSLTPNLLVAGNCQRLWVRRLPHGAWHRLKVPVGFQMHSIARGDDENLIVTGTLPIDVDDKPWNGIVGPLAIYHTRTTQIRRPRFRKKDAEVLKEHELSELLPLNNHHPLIAYWASAIDSKVVHLVMAEKSPRWTLTMFNESVAGCFIPRRGSMALVTRTANLLHTVDRGKSWNQKSIKPAIAGSLRGVAIDDFRIQRLGQISGILLASLSLLRESSDDLVATALVASHDNCMTFDLIHIAWREARLLAYAVEED